MSTLVAQKTIDQQIEEAERNLKMINFNISGLKKRKTTIEKELKSKIMSLRRVTLNSELNAINISLSQLEKASDDIKNKITNLKEAAAEEKKAANNAAAAEKGLANAKAKEKEAEKNTVNEQNALIKLTRNINTRAANVKAAMKGGRRRRGTRRSKASRKARGTRRH